MPDEPLPTTVTMVDPSTGKAHDIPVDQVTRYRAIGFVPESTEAHGGRLANEVREDLYGGAGGTAKAVLAGAARGATLGLSDVAARALGGEDTRIELEGLRDVNPGASFAGELVGAAAPAFFTAGESLPASLAGRAGARAAAAVGGGVRGAAARGATEGVLFGAGTGVGELALSSDPLTVEHAAGVLTSNMLLGGLAGGGIGLGGALLEKGMLRGKAALEGAFARKAVEDATPDLAALDAKGLRQAEKQEIEAIDVARQPTRERFVDDLQSAHRAREPNKDWLAIVADQHEDKYVREAAKSVFNADRKIRNLLDVRAGLLERPIRAKDALQQEAQALERLAAAGQQDLEHFHDAAIAAPDVVRRELINNELPGYVVGKGGISLNSPVLDDIVAREVAVRFPREDGVLVLPKKLQGFADNRIGIARAANRDLQTRLENLLRAPSSERLGQIEAAREALATPHQPSLGEHLLGAAVSVAGPVGTIASIGAKAVGGVKAAVGAAAKRSAEAVSSFLGAGAKAVAAGTPAAATAAAITATEVLSRARFGPTEPGQADDKPALPELFRRRSAELREQTMMAQDGSIQMRPAARMELTRQLAPIAAADSLLADKIETVAARKIAYMSSKIPKRPEVGGIHVGPDNWRPSDLAIRSWARTVRACEDPHGVEVRLANGVVTPEEAEAYRACYPERLMALQRQVFAAVPTLAKTLPTHKKVALYVMTGVPTMPALQPNVLAVLQATFATEPGTAGGTSAPKPLPSFGALGSAKTADQPTAAQKRGG